MPTKSAQKVTMVVANEHVRKFMTMAWHFSKALEGSN
jgi:hypothetical protein